MPFDSNGNAVITRSIAVSGQTVQAVQVNVPFDDVQSMLNQVLLRSGIAPLSGSLSAAGFKIINAANGSADGDYVTMAQLNAVISSVTSANPTGARGSFLMTSAPTGWVVGNGGTIGSASSGATTRANADCEALFTLFWNTFDNSTLPIQTSGGAPSTRGASAAADWAANKRLTIFDLRNDYDRAADSGQGQDPTNVVGTHRNDAIKSFTITGTTDNGGDATPDIFATTSTTAIATPPGNSQFLTVDVTGAGSARSGGIASQVHSHPVTLNYSGASETRPRTTTTLHCIKL